MGSTEKPTKAEPTMKIEPTATEVASVGEVKVMKKELLVKPETTATDTKLTMADNQEPVKEEAKKEPELKPALKKPKPSSEPKDAKKEKKAPPQKSVPPPTT